MAGHVIVDVEGTCLSSEDEAFLKRPEVAGVILFGRNAASKEQVTDLCLSIKAVNPKLVIGVDQEGGRVQRLRDGFCRLPPMRTLGQLWQKDRGQAIFWAQELGYLMAAECRAVGVDISFAPVLDLARDQIPSQVIGDRSFGASVDQVIDLAGAFLKGMLDAGMPGVGKHFPGHGGVSEDSHEELPKDTRLLDSVLSDDARPFQQLPLMGVMPAHIVFPEVDAHFPVGFSDVWLRQILRQRLGFSGLIFSDDLSMAGAASAGSYARRAELAMAAGCDLLLVCNHREGALEVVNHLAGRQLSTTKASLWESCLGEKTAHLTDIDRIGQVKNWCQSL